MGSRRGVRAHGRGVRDRPIPDLSGISHAGALLCAVRLRLQSADRLCRSALVRPCAVLRLGKLPVGLCRQGLGPLARARGSDRHRDRRRARHRRGLHRHPPPGHLLRHDHAGAGADDVFFRAARAVHRRRGRHPDGPGPPPVRADRPVQSAAHVRVRADRCACRLSVDLPHHQFAVRRSAQGDPRKRACAPFRSATGPSATSLPPSSCRRRCPVWLDR